jgi:hypothetical protein
VVLYKNETLAYEPHIMNELEKQYLDINSLVMQYVQIKLYFIIGNASLK